VSIGWAGLSKNRPQIRQRLGKTAFKHAFKIRWKRFFKFRQACALKHIQLAFPIKPVRFIDAFYNRKSFLSTFERENRTSRDSLIPERGKRNNGKAVDNGKSRLLSAMNGRNQGKNVPNTMVYPLFNRNFGGNEFI
jgi:hypothetical protein